MYVLGRQHKLASIKDMKSHLWFLNGLLIYFNDTEIRTNNISYMYNAKETVENTPRIMNITGRCLRNYL